MSADGYCSDCGKLSHHEFCSSCLEVLEAKCRAEGAAQEREAWRLDLEWALGLAPDPENHTSAWFRALVREIREIGNRARGSTPEDGGANGAARVEQASEAIRARAEQAGQNGRWVHNPIHNLLEQCGDAEPTGGAA